MQIQSCINFEVTLRTSTAGFDAVVIPSLGKDKLFLDNKTCSHSIQFSIGVTKG